MDRKNTIVISGYYGFDNIGDEAVLQSIIGALRQEMENVKIIVLSNTPQKTKALYGVEVVNRWKIKEVINAIKQSDLLISGGGSLLQDVTSNKTIPYYLGIIKIAQFLKKPVVLYSQGVGPVNNSLNRKLIKMICSKVNHIFVREIGSKKLLEEIQVKAPITVAIDPVLGIKCKEVAKENIGAKLAEGKNIGVYIRPWKNIDTIATELAPALEHLTKQDCNVYMVPMYYSEDLEAAKLVVQKMNSKIHLIDRELTIDEAVAYTANFDCIIGMRLHSLIMAGAVGTPMLALSYDPKVEGFMKEMALPYCIDTNKIESKEIITMLDELTSQLEIKKEEVKSAYEMHKEKVYLPAKYIKELLK
ncbi:MAG: polysaccharide pyruvyl transferase CsaB [Cellulosilyticaceae bacterium]